MAVDVRAKVSEEFEVTPQSDYVTIKHCGHCKWQPRYESSAVHCTVDVTWFPFDTQSCQLIFESWLMTDDELDITVLSHRNIYEYYLQSEEWELTCETLIIFLYYSVIPNMILTLFFCHNSYKC